MFSSSNINGGSDCFGAQSSFILPSSFQQFGSSSSPPFLEEDHFFMTTQILAMFQGKESFHLGHEEGNLNQLALVDNHGFLDEQVTYGKVMEEEVGSIGKNQAKTIGGSMSDNQINEKVKRSAKRIGTVKKERHSKISTAKGLRDRRMRLSLHIARKFFDLQDKLGFDKASKTIEWLFSMSNNAIKEVMGYSRMDEHISYIDIGTNNISSTDIGWNNHLVPQSNDEIDHKTYDYEDYTTKPVNNTNNKKLRSTRVPKWTQMRKDIRAKARARARERTLEKMALKTLKDPNKVLSLATSSHCFSEQIGSCSAFEYVDSLAVQGQSVEELIHERWEEIEDARLYSCYMFHDTTTQLHDVISSIRYQS